jgi:hypothetical protein
MGYGADYVLEFQDLMQLGKDRAMASLETLAYTGRRVLEKRAPLRRLLSVADVCAVTGLSVQRVKALCGQGRFKGAKRGKGKGTPWQIPGEIVEGTAGTYRPTLYRARKGPALDARVENACNVELERDSVVPF